jgi:hypothetical protein
MVIVVDLPSILGCKGEKVFLFSKMSLDPQGLSTDLVHCLRQLEEATTDEERFVALLILPRLLDVQNLNQLKAAFSRIDMSFIERLLRTSKLKRQ